MPSQTVQVSNVQVKLPPQQQTQASYLQYLGAKIEVIMEQVSYDKKQMEDQFLKEKRQLEQQIKDSRNKIEQLQKMIYEMQLQSQQVHHRSQQMMVRVNIIRKENLSMSHRFAKEKRQMEQAMQRLVLQNEDLKKILLQLAYNNQSNYLSPRKTNRSPTITINHMCPSFCHGWREYKHLNKFTSKDRYKSPKRQPVLQGSQMSSSIFESGMDQNLSLMDTLNLQKRQKSDFSGSIVTKQNKRIYMRDAEEMQTKTQLSPRYYISKDTKKRL